VLLTPNASFLANIWWKKVAGNIAKFNFVGENGGESRSVSGIVEGELLV